VLRILQFKNKIKKKNKHKILTYTCKGRIGIKQIYRGVERIYGGVGKFFHFTHGLYGLLVTYMTVSK